MEEMEEMEDESESESESDDEAEDSKATKQRHSNGRFKALPNRRRVAPSTMHANISDAIGALEEEDDIWLPTMGEIMRMRGQLTVASEAIAAFRVALSKRIVSFGWDESG